MANVRAIAHFWLPLSMKLVLAVVLGCWLAIGCLTPAWAADVPAGAQVFEAHCIGCHLNGGNIIRGGKNLKQKALERNGYATPEAIAQIVTNGKANMSAYKDRLTPAEIEDVAAYVLQQAQQNWPR